MWFRKPCIFSRADLIKKLLRTTQNVLELSQLQEVLLQGFLVGVYFLQLILKLLERGLWGDVQKVQQRDAEDNRPQCLSERESR